MKDFKVSDEVVEDAARAIYDQFDYPPTESGTKPKWVERGNSLMQVKARNYARAAIEAVVPVMLSQRGWLGIDTISGYTRIHESEDDFSHLKDKDWFIAVPLYRLKESK